MSLRIGCLHLHVAALGSRPPLRLAPTDFTERAIKFTAQQSRDQELPLPCGAQVRKRWGWDGSDPCPVGSRLPPCLLGTCVCRGSSRLCPGTSSRIGTGEWLSPLCRAQMRRVGVRQLRSLLYPGTAAPASSQPSGVKPGSCPERTPWDRSPS